MAPNNLKLPVSVAGQMDVTRLVRELKNLEDFFTSAAMRAGGTPMTPPRLSRLLDQTAKENQCNLLDQKQRVDLTERLSQVLKTAPFMHISFAADPQAKFMESIVVWLRENIHPQALVQVGLQPTIAAGCVLRTSNQVFDMSLRSNLKKQEPYLAQLIAGANHEA